MKEIDNSMIKWKKRNFLQKVTMLFWIFFIGSIIGYVIESIVGIVQNGHFVSRQGLLFGPFIPVYGVGLAIYYLVISLIKQKKNWKIFLLSMLLGGMVEYFFSFFQESLFGTISWDYSHLLFNLHGRTSLLHCIYWGIGGVLFVRFLLPLIERMKLWQKNSYFKWITTVCLLFMMFDIVISGMVGIRQLERKNNVAAKDYMDYYFDIHYPDTKLEKIFSNTKAVTK